MTEVDISVSNVLSWYHNLRTKLGVDAAKADDISQAVCYIDYVEGDNPQRLVYSRFQKSDLPQVQMLRIICDTLLIALADKTHSLTCPQSHKVYGCQCKRGIEYADLAECVTILQYLESLSKDYSELIEVLKDFGGIWEEFGFSVERKLCVPQALKNDVSGAELQFVNRGIDDPLDVARWYTSYAGEGMLKSLRAAYEANATHCAGKMAYVQKSFDGYCIKLACPMEGYPQRRGIKESCEVIMMSEDSKRIDELRKSCLEALLLKRYLDAPDVLPEYVKIAFNSDGVHYTGE